MALNQDERAWLAKQTELTACEQQAFTGARNQIWHNGISSANDEPQARLDAALVRYLLESRTGSKSGS